MLDDGIRINRTMNDPNGNIPNNAPNAPVFANGMNNAEIPTITLTPVLPLAIDNIPMQLVPELNFYSATLYDGTLKPVIVTQDSDTHVLWHALRYQLLYKTFNHAEGLFHRSLLLRSTYPFSITSGPLTRRCKKDVILCAALVCCQVATNQLHNFMSGSIKTCNSWAERNPTWFDKASMTASLISQFYTIPSHPDFTRVLTVQNIMNCNIYDGMMKLRRRLDRHGIVSELGHDVRVGTDILDAVYLPLFLFLDSIFPNSFWRDVCPTNKIWIGQNEMNSLTTNVRLM
jgi:hypothetical protein